MKHTGKIQLEFAKIALSKRSTRWEDLTYEQQKKYLRQHPKSKKKMTAKKYWLSSEEFFDKNRQEPKEVLTDWHKPTTGKKEFEPLKWDDYPYAAQEEYLKRNPESSRTMTAKKPQSSDDLLQDIKDYEKEHGIDDAKEQVKEKKQQLTKDNILTQIQSNEKFETGQEFPEKGQLFNFNGTNYRYLQSEPNHGGEIIQSETGQLSWIDSEELVLGDMNEITDDEALSFKQNEKVSTDDSDIIQYGGYSYRNLGPVHGEKEGLAILNNEGQLAIVDEEEVLSESTDITDEQIKDFKLKESKYRKNNWNQSL